MPVKKLTIACVISLWAVPASAENIFLKDGSIHKGRIITETAATVTVKLDTGPQKTFWRNNILRILYSNLFLGKRYIRLNSGQMIEAYQVAEDRDTYTFRKELYKPEEFTMKRSEVLFMTRSNPSGLKGRPDTDRISLVWFAPFRSPHGYRVYYKQNKGDEYTLAGKTGRTRLTLKGLETRKTYYIIVTAIDREGKESLPSNEIVIKTNIPPEKPRRTKYRVVSKKKESADIEITWEPGTDKDGSVTSYRIYQKNSYAEEKVEETVETRAVISDISLDRDRHFLVRTLDNDGTESFDSRVSILKQRFSITPTGGCILPLRNFGRVIDPGFSVGVNLSINNFLANYLNVGLETGYSRLLFALDGTYMLSMIPILGSLAYQFEITPLFSLCLKASGGAYYLNAKRTASNFSSIFMSAEINAFEPAATVGLGIQFQVLEVLSIKVDTAYGMIFEKEPMDYVSITAGCGLRFQI